MNNIYQKQPTCKAKLLLIWACQRRHYSPKLPSIRLSVALIVILNCRSIKHHKRGPCSAGEINAGAKIVYKVICKGSTNVDEGNFFFFSFFPFCRVNIVALGESLKQWFERATTTKKKKLFIYHYRHGLSQMITICLHPIFRQWATIESGKAI